MLVTACGEDAIQSIYDKMPLRTCDHNTIDIIEIVIPKRLIRGSFFLICLECTFKLRQILRDKIHHPLVFFLRSFQSQ